MKFTLRTVTAALTALAVAVIGFVLFSQYGQGYQPCELCLRERIPWYAAIGAGVVGIVAPSRTILALLALMMLASAGLGLHHVGVEQHWWAGPSACTGGGSGAKTAAELLAMMRAQQFVQCDAISWTLAGLSMATYNLIVSLAAALAAAAIWVGSRRAGHAA
jgi:disulfide bond formation protein DsbB